MYLNDLFEATGHRKIIVVYPGRFHLFTKAHKEVYDYLRAKFNADVYITTSNKHGDEKNPFSFPEKVVMMKAAGIDPKFISKETVPYVPTNLMMKVDPDKYSVIFAVGAKDMEKDNPRFSIGYKKNGDPTYFQLLGDKKPHELMGVLDHGYLDVAPTIKGSNGQPMSATTERANFTKAFKQGRKAVDELITNLYGKENSSNNALRKVLNKLATTVTESVSSTSRHGKLTTREVTTPSDYGSMLGNIYYLNKEPIAFATRDNSHKSYIEKEDVVEIQILPIVMMGPSSYYPDTNNIIKRVYIDANDYLLNGNSTKHPLVDKMVYRNLHRLIKNKKIIEDKTIIGSYGSPKASKGVSKNYKDTQGTGIGKPGKTAKHGKSGQKGFVGNSVDHTDETLNEIWSPKVIKPRRGPRRSNIIPNVGASYHFMLQKLHNVIDRIEDNDDEMSKGQKAHVRKMIERLTTKIISEGILDEEGVKTWSDMKKDYNNLKNHFFPNKEEETPKYSAVPSRQKNNSNRMPPTKQSLPRKFRRNSIFRKDSDSKPKVTRQHKNTDDSILPTWDDFKKPGNWLIGN